jgi:hypothetical protein
VATLSILGGFITLGLGGGGEPVVTTGSFIGTLVGCTTSPTATFYWERVGNFVGIARNNAESLQGTSNSTAMRVDGLPLAISPAGRTSTAACIVTDNNVEKLGMVQLGSQQLNFYLGASLVFTGFTASSGKGVPFNWSVVFLLYP